MTYRFLLEDSNFLLKEDNNHILLEVLEIIIDTIMGILNWGKMTSDEDKAAGLFTAVRPSLGVDTGITMSSSNEIPAGSILESERPSL